MNRLEFKSKSGAVYIYDDKTSNIYPKEIQDKVSRNTRRITQKNIDVEEYLANNGFGQLTLIVDEMCNMRCKYCVYSGEYNNNRLHNYKKMTFETAKKAIDYYIVKSAEALKVNHNLRPVIGFYGGEPLLNFELIKKCIKYIEGKNLKFKFMYTLTTNLTLLNEKMLKFLVKNEVYMCISLNGGEKENDRLRVFSDGRGTYSKIKEKLELIRNKYPKYLEKCYYSNTFDTLSNLQELENFFEFGELSDVKLARASGVSIDFTNWYDQYTQQEKKEFKKSYELLKDDFINKVINGEKLSSLQEKLFLPQYIGLLNRCRLISVENQSPYYKNRCGTCVPGEKLAVNPDGQILICEKTNYSRPIGTVLAGIEEKLVLNLISDFNEVTKSCVNCPISRLCIKCYASLIDNDGDLVTKNREECKKSISNVQTLLSDLYTMLEQNNNIYKYCRLYSIGGING